MILFHHKRFFSGDPLALLIISALLWSFVACYFFFVRIPFTDLNDPLYQRYLDIFNVWDQVPVYKHLFIPFLKGMGEGYEKGHAYTNYPQSYLLLIYTLTNSLSYLFSINRQSALALYGLLFTFLASGLVVSLIHKLSLPATILRWPGLILAFLAIGVIATHPYFPLSGTYFLGVEMEPFATFAFIVFATRYMEGSIHSPVTFLFILLSSVFAPLYTPVLILLLLTLKYEHKWHLFYAGIIGALSLLGPKVGFYILGLTKDSGSSLSYRTGLDGDTSYFSNPFQAFWNPYDIEGRLWRITPYLAGPLCCLMLSIYFRRGISLAIPWLRWWFCATSPYIFLLILFPQAVSIHPYTFDVHFLIPSVFFVCLWTICPESLKRLKGTLLFFWCLLLSGLIIHNLTDVSRAGRLRNVSHKTLQPK